MADFPRIVLPGLNVPLPPAAPAAKLPSGAAPPMHIPGLAGPLAPSTDPSRYEPVKNVATVNSFTYLTKASGKTELLYTTNPMEWARVTLRLNTAGPVNAGTQQSVDPVGSNKGVDLPTMIDVEFNMPPSSRLFIVSNTVDRVSVVVNPLPWLYQILGTIERLAQMHMVLPARVSGGVASALARLLKKGAK